MLFRSRRQGGAGPLSRTRVGALQTLGYVTMAGLFCGPTAAASLAVTCGILWEIMLQPDRGDQRRAKSVRYDKAIAVGNGHI